MKVNGAILFFCLGAMSVLAFEGAVLPKVQNGWNEVNDARMDYCRQRSRKWYRKVTFQVTRTYHRCMDKEI